MKQDLSHQRIKRLNLPAMQAVRNIVTINFQVFTDNYLDKQQEDKIDT